MPDNWITQGMAPWELTPVETLATRVREDTIRHRGNIMYGAFLQVDEDRWTFTRSTTKILDHQGDLVMCDDADDYRHCAAAIEARVGRSAFQYDDVVITVPEDVIEDREEALREARENPGRVVRAISRELRAHRNPGFSRHEDFRWVWLRNRDSRWVRKTTEFNLNPDGSVHLALVKDKSAINNGDLPPSHPDYHKFLKGFVIAEDHNMAVQVAYVPEAFRRLKRQIDDYRPGYSRSSRADRVGGPPMRDVARQIAKALDIGSFKFRNEHIMLWVAAHDSVFGRRETNKILSSLAKAWKKEAPEAWKYNRRHISKENLRRFVERLKCIVKMPDFEMD